MFQTQSTPARLGAVAADDWTPARLTALAWPTTLFGPDPVEPTRRGVALTWIRETGLRPTTEQEVSWTNSIGNMLSKPSDLVNWLTQWNGPAGGFANGAMTKADSRAKNPEGVARANAALTGASGGDGRLFGLQPMTWLLVALGVGLASNSGPRR